MLRSNRFSMLLSLVVAFIGPQILFAEKPTPLEKATLTYEKSRDKAKESLLVNFDKAIKQAGRMTPVTKARKIREILEREKERFEDDGLIPWSQPMWTYMTLYLKQMQYADKALRRVYDSAIRDASQVGNSDMVKQLEAELDATLDYKPIAKWKHRDDNINHYYIKGHILQPDSKATWTIGSGGVLIHRWSDPRAPGGA